MADAPKKTPGTEAPFDISKAMGSLDPTAIFQQLSGMFGQYKVPGFDVDTLVASQRKNVEALTAANRVAVEGLQALAKRQVEIFQETMAQASQALQSVTQAGSPPELAAKQAQFAREAFERALGNMKELAEIVAKSSQEATNLINARVAETLQEMRNLAQKK
jgi:phasin family protein